MFLEKGVLKICSKFTGKSNRFIKITLRHEQNRTPSYTNTSGNCFLEKLKPVVNQSVFQETKIYIFRSNHQRCSVRIGVLRNFAKFTGKHLCQSLFFDKAAGPHIETSQLICTATLLKKRSWRRCFPVNFAKFLKTPFL